MNEQKMTAITILEQLGGNKFVAMTGANNFVYDKHGTILFSFKGSKVFNKLKIRLNSMDTYDMTFFKLGRAPNFKLTNKEINGVYYDQLQGVFTAETGLNCCL